MPGLLACRERIPGERVGKGRQIIFKSSEYSQDDPGSVTIVEPLADAAAPVARKKPGARGARFSKRWLSNAFRFRLHSFLPGHGSLSLRRFSITEAAVLLMLAFILSRGLGVGRQTLFNMLFGTGPAANAYYAAVYLPETLFDLVAGGALIHAFLPVFLSHEKAQGTREVWRLTSLVFNVMLVALVLLVLLGEFFAPAFVQHWLVPGYSPAEQRLTTTLTRVLLIQPLLLGLGTVITAALNSKRQFLLPAVSVAIYNIGLIGGLGVSLWFRSVGIYGPTCGILVATALQVLVMVPALLKQGARYSFTWDLRHPAFLEVLRLLVPNVLAVAAGSVTPIIDTAFISYIPDMASLSASRNAYMLYALPLALVSQAVGQAAMPQLAALATVRKYVRLRQTLARVLLTALAFSALAALALWILGHPAIRILFQHGAFTAHSVDMTRLALIGYALALPGQAVGSLLTLTFYAMKNATLPLMATILSLLAHLGSLVLFFALFSGSNKILAVPLSFAVDGLVLSLLLGTLLFLGLRTKASQDKGMLRLMRRRAFLRAAHPGQHI